MTPIELVFDDADARWEFHSPSGVALGAARRLSDDILVEADIADPWVLTSVTATDTARGRGFLTACFGAGVERLLDTRSTGTAEADPLKQPLRLEVGRWALADDRAEATAGNPIVQAGWLIDAALHASDLGRKIPGTIDADRTYGHALKEATETVTQGDPLAVSHYTKRRVDATATELRRRGVPLARHVQRVANWLATTSEVPTRRHLSPRIPVASPDRVEINGALSAGSLEAQRFDAGNDIHVHLTPTDPAVTGRPLWVRAINDGLLVALASVRWTSETPPGRAQLLVPDPTTVWLEITDQPEAPVPSARETTLRVLAAVTDAAASVVADERLDSARPEDWLTIGDGWGTIGDQDRKWLACDRAFSASQSQRQGHPPGGPRSLSQLLSDGPSNPIQTKIADSAMRLTTTWGEKRSIEVLAVRMESFIGDQFQRAFETVAHH